MPDIRFFQGEFHAELVHAPAANTPMQVYRNTALLGAVDALAANFPVTRTVVGEHGFEALAAAHARAHPPESPVLADYGRHFATWLAEQTIAAELAYIADIAICDRLWVEALHAADAAVLVLEELDAFEPEQLLSLRLRLHPAARHAWLSSPAMPIWLAHQDKTVEEIEVTWRRSGALLTRPFLSVEGHELDAPSHRLFSGIRLGEALGSAAGAASRLYPEADIGSCLAGLVQCGAFAALNQERTMR